MCTEIMGVMDDNNALRKANTLNIELYRGEKMLKKKVTLK